MTFLERILGWFASLNTIVQTTILICITLVICVALMVGGD